MRINSQDRQQINEIIDQQSSPKYVRTSSTHISTHSPTDAPSHFFIPQPLSNSREVKAHVQSASQEPANALNKHVPCFSIHATLGKYRISISGYHLISDYYFLIRLCRSILFYSTIKRSKVQS